MLCGGDGSLDMAGDEAFLFMGGRSEFPIGLEKMADSLRDMAMAMAVLGWVWRGTLGYV